MPLELPDHMRLIGRLNSRKSGRGNLWYSGRVNGARVSAFTDTAADGSIVLTLYHDTSPPPAAPAARPADRARARIPERHRRSATPPAPLFDDALEDVLPLDGDIAR